MRRLLIVCVLIVLAGGLLLGYSVIAAGPQAAPRAIPTATADPLVWPGCKSCDVQRSHMQATAATAP